MLYSKRTDVRSRLKHQIKWRGLALLIVLLILSGCGGGSSGSNNQATSTVSPTNARFAGLAKETHFKTLRTLRVSNSAITATSTAAPAGPTPFTATGSFTLPVQDFSFQVSELFGTILFHYGFPSSQDPALLPLPQSFASTALIPTVSADEQFATTSLVDGGITLTLRNDQNQDSYTFAGPPSGSNVTYLSNDTVVNADGTTTWDWFASITFASGWTVVVGQDVFFDPGTGFGGFEQFSRQMWFIRPNLPQITVDNPTVVHGDSVQNTTTLNFQISTSNNTLNAWSVAAVQNGTTLKSFAPTADTRGPGVTNGSNPLNVSLTWDGVDSSNNRVAGDFNWVVTANTTNFVAGGPVNDGVNSTQVVVADATASVSIENATATPANFAAGEKSTLSFDINVKGLVQPTTYWLVSIKDSSNTTVLNRSVLAKSLQANSIIISPPPNPFFTFEQGTNTDGRTMVHVVMLPWDGKGATNTTISGPFTWVIDAQATSAGNTAPVIAQEVTLETGEKSLKIFRPSGNTVVGVAYHVNPDEDTLAQRLARRKLLKAAVEDETKNWKISASGLKFSGTPPDTIVATLQGNLSQVPVAVNLTISSRDNATHIGNYTSSNYVSNGILTSASVIIDPIVVNGTAAKTTYFGSFRSLINATTGELDTALTFLNSVMLAGSTTIAYPKARAALGSMYGDLARITDIQLARPGTSLIEDSDKVPPSQQSFNQCGFEAVTIRLSGAGLADTLQAVVKVGHAARVVFLNDHGEHRDGKLFIGNDTIIPILAAKPISAKTDTLALLACSALDLNDYNNFFSAPFAQNGTVGVPGATATDYHASTADISQRKFGGLNWYNTTRYASNRNGHTGTTLLGYSSYASAITSSNAIRNYQTNLANGGEAMAWMKANLTTGNGTNGGQVPFWLALGACAWDTVAVNGTATDVFYYIPYKVPQLKSLAGVTPTPIDGLGVWMIPKSSWTKDRVDWNRLDTIDINGTQVFP